MKLKEVKVAEMVANITTIFSKKGVLKNLDKRSHQVKTKRPQVFFPSYDNRGRVIFREDRVLKNLDERDHELKIKRLWSLFSKLCRKSSEIAN